MQKLIGILLLVVGAAICGALLGFLPVDAAALEAPRWVLGSAAGVSVIAGLAIFARDHRGSDALAALLLLSLSAIGIWVFFFSPEGSFEEGIPFIPPIANESLARTLFGLGGGGCLLMALWAIWRLFR